MLGILRTRRRIESCIDCYELISEDIFISRVILSCPKGASLCGALREASRRLVRPEAIGNEAFGPIDAPPKLVSDYN